jgi:hypothetical protein
MLLRDKTRSDLATPGPVQMAIDVDPQNTM